MSKAKASKPSSESGSSCDSSDTEFDENNAKKQGNNQLNVKPSTACGTMSKAKASKPSSESGSSCDSSDTELGGNNAKKQRNDQLNVKPSTACGTMSKAKASKPSSESGSSCDSSDTELGGNNAKKQGNDKDLGDSVDQLKRIIVRGCKHTKQKFVFDKVDVCFYCQKKVLCTSFVRHINAFHRSKDDVVEINRLQKGSLKKKRLLQLLRNAGNFKHNVDVLRNGGELIVVQRPKVDLDITEKKNLYSSCSHCYGFYYSTELWRHTCPSTNITKKKKISRDSLNLEIEDPDLCQFYNRMCKDDITDIAKEDGLIQKYISKELIMRGMKKYKSISAKVRSLCGFLQKYRKITKKSADFKSILIPSNVEQIKKIAMRMYDYNVDSTDLDTNVSMTRPSSLKKLGLALIQLVQTLRVEFLKIGDSDSVSETTNLLDLMEAEIRPLMTNAGLVMDSANHGLPKELPNDDQLSKLKKYIKKTLSRRLRMKNRRKMAETVLAYIILFNKRRPGETSRLTKEIWNERRKWKEFTFQEKDKLSSDEMALIDNLELVYVKGKGNRFVPILFPKDSIKVVQWLSECTSKYIFENRNKNPIRGNDAMSNVVRRAKVSGKNISSTNFRKLAATTLQLENFNEAEYRFICDHLGHSLDVHKRWYRMRNTTVEFVKVGKILKDDFDKGTRHADADAAATLEKGKWTAEQTAYLTRRCARYIGSNITLRKEEALEIKNENQELFIGRTWKEIKDKVRNEAVKECRKL